jgi:uncharacterized lipoprotein YehR (DUF1307 family)
MKKFVKLFVVVLAAAALFTLTTCDDDDILPKGGKIIVTNGFPSTALVWVIKGIEVTDGSGKKTISSGESSEWVYNEDGWYTVVATSVDDLFGGFNKSVILIGGNTERVTLSAAED